MPKTPAVEWIDILRPTKTDLAELKRRFHLHEIIVDELKGPSARSRVEVYNSYIFLIYYFPVFDPKDQFSRESEIDFIVSKDAVVTTHYERLEALENFKNSRAKNSLELTYQLIQALISFQERQLRHIHEKVERVGAELFKNKEKEILTTISHLKRDISEYRMIVNHQGPILNSFIAHGEKFWGEKARMYLNDLVGDHLKVVNRLENYRESLLDFEDTNDQLMDVKTNEVMKTFTILAFLTFPLMLFATLFSMRTQDTPLIDQPHAFWIVIGIMAVAMLGMYGYFKQKGWL